MDEQEKIVRGLLLAKILELKECYIVTKENIRYRTKWGTKTPLGLYETVNRILTDNIKNII